VNLPRGRIGTASGWSRHVVEPCTLYRPRSLDELAAIVTRAPTRSVLSRGLGRSYGDAALNRDQGLILHQELNRFLSFDPESGILECEAAVSLSEIIDFLLPRGFALPVTPGTRFVSLGGAIAADIHGKNHHRDGTISGQLLDFRLLTAEGKVLRCSREENADLFWATLGGMGLTGAILEARLRMRRVGSAWVHSTTTRCANLEQALSRILEEDERYEYAVAWVDCLARGRSLGRSVLLRANVAPADSLPAVLRGHPHRVKPALRLGVPFDFPSVVLNPIDMRLFNEAIWQVHREGETLTGYQRYFYPLDAIQHWSRIYGKRGVLQYQLVLPRESCHAGLSEVLERTVASRRGSFLAVLKSTGPENSGLLSFPREGASLALDFANSGRELLALLDALDEIVLRHGGRVYLAKDCRLPANHFRAMYPRLAQFRAVKARYDPEWRFSSSLARRLQIQESA
jgi:decaprenylphospho-beta-D-ribofuranose 2-oxidase